jgi:hypothetical protein
MRLLPFGLKRYDLFLKGKRARSWWLIRVVVVPVLTRSRSLQVANHGSIGPSVFRE